MKMNKLFRGKNSGNSYLWIIAENEYEATQIALKNRFVKKISNLKLTETDKDNVTHFDFFHRKGNIMTEVENKKGIGAVYYDGKPNSPGVWVVHEIEMK